MQPGLRYSKHTVHKFHKLMLLCCPHCTFESRFSQREGCTANDERANFWLSTEIALLPMLQLWVQKITETWVHCGKHTARKFRASRNLEDSFTQAQALAAENADLRRSLTERQAQGDDMQRWSRRCKSRRLAAAAMPLMWKQAARMTAMQSTCSLGTTVASCSSHQLHCCWSPRCLASMMLCASMLCLVTGSLQALFLRHMETGLPLLGGCFDAKWLQLGRGCISMGTLQPALLSCEYALKLHGLL